MNDYRDESTGYKWAVGMVGLAALLVVIGCVKGLYDWVMSPVNFVAVTFIIVLIARKVRLSYNARLVLAIGYLIFFSGYIGHTVHHSSDASHALGTAAGGVATATGGGVVR